MFEGWDSFYLMIGGAAGALIGLLFIVVTLIRGGDAATKLRTTGVYMTPTVAHLAMVLVLSAVATAPSLSLAIDGVIFGACALACLGFAARALLMFGIRSVQATHWSDILAYGIAPLVLCSSLAISAAAVWLSPAWAARGIAASLLALLLLAIRNAWDLVTWITAKADELDKS
jgi:hypothetical protein